MTVNKGTCFNCGQPSEDYEEIGNVTLYVCSQRQCQRELRYELERAESEKRERAEEDDYSRYDY
jgi:hypothetical protein